MDPFSATMAGISGVSGGVNSALNYRSSEKNRDQSARFAKKKYRYAVSDMKKAGLNPILAAGGITGASANTSMPNLENLGIAATSALQQTSQDRVNDAKAREINQTVAIKKPLENLTDPVEKLTSDIAEKANDVYSTAKDVGKSYIQDVNKSVQKIKKQNKANKKKKQPHQSWKPRSHDSGIKQFR